MKHLYTIGIDIGGTNTDAVLIDSQQRIQAHVKVPTTASLEKGFGQALSQILQQSELATSNLRAIFVGTTHATNAILQCQDLYQVGVLRLAGHHPQTLPPAYAWPKALRQAALAGIECVHGGFECDGRALTPIVSGEIVNAVERLLAKGAESLAITGVFSPLYGSQESEAATVIREHFKGLTI